MQIIAQCPRCSNAWQLTADAADRRVKCPDCAMLFKIPKLQEIPKALKVIENINGTVYVDQDGNTYG